MGNLLSIDQSLTCTGTCVFDDAGHLTYFECIKTTNDESVVGRISYISERVIQLYQTNQCTDIVFEQLSYGSMGDATRNLAGLLFTIETKLYERLGIDDIIKLAPTAVKKFATGFGGSSKKKVTKADMWESLPDIVVEEFLDMGYKKTKGGYDLTDAYFIGKLHMENNRKLTLIADNLLNEG